MNERQAYEKHLADKLQQLPPPADMDRNWERMRLLLDNDLPRGGGWGGNRWWLTGVIAGLLLISAWLATQFISANDTRQQPATAAVMPATALPQQASPAPDGAVADKATVTDNAGNKPPAYHQPAAAAGNLSGKPDISPPVALQPTPATGIEKSKPQKIGHINPETKQNNPITLANSNNNDAINFTKPVKDKISVQEKEETNDQPAYNGSKKPGRYNKPGAITEEAGKAGNAIAIGKTKQPNAVTDNATNPSLVKQNIDASSLAVQSPSAAITFNYAPAGFAKTELTPKKAAKTQLPKLVRSRTFAIGLSLPLAFPLGDQQALSYNSRAGVNTVSDYIPAPHLQYHFNNKTYLQTEVQVSSPQYIRPILLFQDKSEPTPGNYIYNSVYARKLYYLNIPVGIHHSPFKNFYLGTGLQFSSMLSGIALYEQRRQGSGPGQGYLLNEHYSRFSNDSLSQRFNGTEMRLLLDANYYWQRFTVGLRYNQAFTNYVSFRLNNNTPYTYDKNKALQFYLRYNLWEDKKRVSNSPKTMLSLK